jgi:4-carboxymuconolactone decarboxylase
MTRFRHLPEVSRQIVILVVGTRFRAAYEIYAHSAVARSVGVTEDQIATITAGKRPADLSEEAQVAYDVAADRQPLKDAHKGAQPLGLGRVLES